MTTAPQSLHDELPALRELDEIRRRATALRDDGLRLLMTPLPKAKGEDLPTIANPDTVSDIGLFLRAITIAQSRLPALLPEHTSGRILREVAVHALAAKRTKRDPDWTNDVVSTAQLVQGLFRSPMKGTKAVREAAAQSICDLLRTSPAEKRGMTGGARSAPFQRQSAFVTGECIRALRTRAWAWRETADLRGLAVRVAERTAILQHQCFSTGPLADWKAKEEARWGASIRLLSASLERVTAVPDRQFSSDGAPECGSLAAARTNQGLRHTKANPVPWSFPASVATAPVRGKKIETPDEKWTLSLQAAAHFVLAQLRQELDAADASDGRAFDAGEMAFAAAGYAALLDERVPGVRPERSLLDKCAAHLSLVVDELGRVGAARPHHVESDGTCRVAPHAEMIRAYCAVMEAASPQLRAEPRVFRALLENFERTRLVNQAGALRGWRREWSRPGDQDEVQCAPTCQAIIALDHIVTALDKKINDAMATHFRVVPPSQIKDDLKDLANGDYTNPGLVSNGKLENKAENTLGYLFQRMRSHLLRVHVKDIKPLTNMLIFGPAGTGKTAGVEGLAKSCALPLVRLSPGAVEFDGERFKARRAEEVFEALAMMTGCVILLDEFDSVLAMRSPPAAGSSNTVQNVLLPALKQLHEVAEANRIVYVLCTNFYAQLDDALTRDGRFDAHVGVAELSETSIEGVLTLQALKLGLVPTPTRIAAIANAWKWSSMANFGKNLRKEKLADLLSVPDPADGIAMEAPEPLGERPSARAALEYELRTWARRGDLNPATRSTGRGRRTRPIEVL